MNSNFNPIGFIGTGLMGVPFIKRLSEVNYLINAYDKRQEKLELLKGKIKYLYLLTLLKYLKIVT